MGLLGTVPYLGLRRGWIAGWAGSLQQSLCFDSYMGASPEHECKTLIQCVRVMCCVLCVPPFYLRHCCLLCCCGPMSHALPLPPCRPGLTIGVPVGSPLPGLDAPCTAAYCATAAQCITHCCQLCYCFCLAAGAFCCAASPSCTSFRTPSASSSPSSSSDNKSRGSSSYLQGGTCRQESSSINWACKQTCPALPTQLTHATSFLNLCAVSLPFYWMETLRGRGGNKSV